MHEIEVVCCILMQSIDALRGAVLYDALSGRGLSPVWLMTWHITPYSHHFSLSPPLFKSIPLSVNYWHNAKNKFIKCSTIITVLREILQLHSAHGYFKCFDMQGNRILSSGRARASLQPLASFPCYQRPLTHTTDVLREGSRKKNRKKFSDLLNPPRTPPGPRFSIFSEQKIYPNFFCWKLHL